MLMHPDIMLLHSADEHLDELKAAKCVILLSYSSEPLFCTCQASRERCPLEDDTFGGLELVLVLLSYSSEPICFTQSLFSS